MNDAIEALKSAIGAPARHGDGIDAFIDSMIVHDEINTLRSPYTLMITGLRDAAPDARQFACDFADSINRAGMSDHGTDLEIRIVVEDGS